MVWAIGLPMDQARVVSLRTTVTLVTLPHLGRVVLVVNGVSRPVFLSNQVSNNNVFISKSITITIITNIEFITTAHPPAQNQIYPA